MTYIDIVFSGPPSEPATFVEVENPAGASISVGEWLQRPDGYWVLRIPSPVAPVATSSSDDSVIEEAAKAMYFEDCGVAALGDDAEPFREMARIALAVFEKAHAPTDDEREALIAELDKATDYCGRAYDGFGPVADAILAAGFRRSEVPEPSAEAWVCRKCGGSAYEHSLTTSTCIWEPIETRPESHALTPSGAYSVCASCGLADFQHDREPQGEPPDAQINDAWWKAQEAGELPRTPGPSNRESFEVGYRAAMRAAGGEGRGMDNLTSQEYLTLSAQAFEGDDDTIEGGSR